MNLNRIKQLVAEEVSLVLEKMDVPKVVANQGDVAEGVLGAALTAAFVYPGVPVSMASVWAIISDLNKNSDASKSEKTVIKSKTYEIKSKNKPSSKTDKVTLTIGLASSNFTGLTNKGFFSSMAPIVGGAIKYANSKGVQAQVQKIFLDPKSNSVEIRSVGTEDQKGTKVDLKVIMDGELIPWGAMSLKAGGTKQMGQAGKGFFTSDEDLAAKKSRGIGNLFKSLFGIQIDQNLRNGYEHAIAQGSKEELSKELFKLYNNAANKIYQRFGGGEEEVVDFLKTLARGIQKEAVLDETEVVLIHLSGGDFKALDFNKLVQLMDDDSVEVEISAEVEADKSVPYLSVSMIINGQDYGKIISIRPKVRFKMNPDGSESLGEFRHYVEKEHGLVKLISVTQ